MAACRPTDPMSPEEPVDPGMLPTLLGFRLRVAHHAVVRDFIRSLSELELTPPMFGALELMRANPGLSQTALAQALELDRSTVVPLIDALARRGLAERRPSVTDRRRNQLWLTPGGQQLHRRAAQKVRDHEARLFAALGEGGRARLPALLERIGREG